MLLTGWLAIWADEESFGCSAIRHGRFKKPAHALSLTTSTCASPTFVTHGLSFDPRPKVMYPPKPDKAPMPTLPIPATDLVVVGMEAISVVDMVSRENRTCSASYAKQRISEFRKVMVRAECGRGASCEIVTKKQGIFVLVDEP